MTTQQVMIQSGRVTTEGDDLYYEVRGQGQPLLMIAPGGGDGWQYSFVANILADEYKVITYDRRANARSTMNQPQNFEVSQQSRDALAVLRAVGEESAFVFGNSSGAVIALDMAKTQPQAVRAVVAHEPPIPRVHPQAKKWQRFFARVCPSLTTYRMSRGSSKTGSGYSWRLANGLWIERPGTLKRLKIWRNSSAVNSSLSPAIMVLLWICRMNSPPRCAVSYIKRKKRKQ